MKTKTYKWGLETYTFYKPRANKWKQVPLISFIIATGFLPGPNFIGLPVLKLIQKLNPFWVYK